MWYRNRWVIGIAAFVLGAAVTGGGMSLSRATTSTSSTAAGTSAQVTELQKKLDAANAQIAAPIADASGYPSAVTSTSAPESTPKTFMYFSTGTYLVGKALPAGAYSGKTTRSPGYWQISKDAKGRKIVSKMVTTGSFSLRVETGQYLTLKDVVVHKVE